MNRLLLLVASRLPLVAAKAAPQAVKPAVPWTLPTLFARVPPLKHSNAGRFPLVCIEAFKLSETDDSWAHAKPFPPDAIRELARRGLTQWIPPRDKYIPFALALQQNGARVIMVEGDAFNGPGGIAADLHILPKDFARDPDQPAQQPSYPCPLLLGGWKQKADELRATFGKYKAAGVAVDAVWLDWEVEPFPGKSEWREAKACSRCRTMFPPGVLDDFARYRNFIALWRRDLFSAYVAAPIQEVYPRCSITNWEAVISTPRRPTPAWSGSGSLPPQDPGMMTAANPVAYGNTAWYAINWRKEWNWPLDEAHMDRVYTQVMLGEISAHEANARETAPEKGSIPWVDRVCLDDPDPKIPLLSRTRYREILRHCWLRGANGMQVFNPHFSTPEADKSAIQTAEVEDTQAIYDEMLAYRTFLEAGEPMNLTQPTATFDGAIWSGLRLGDEAIVRAFTQSKTPVTLSFTPFPARAPATSTSIQLICPPEGATYLLHREGDKVMVEKQPANRSN